MTTTVKKGARSRFKPHKVTSDLLLTLTQENLAAAEDKSFDLSRAQVVHLLYFVLALQRRLVPHNVADRIWSGTGRDLRFALADWEPGSVLCGGTHLTESANVDLALEGLLAEARGEIWPGELLSNLLDRVDVYAKPHGDNGAHARYERRYGGAYYTDQRLVDAVVRETLKPMLERQQSVAELLSLRIIDPAVGSANFLVQALSHVALALHELSGEDLASCRRETLEQCIYGVDVDPLAAGAARAVLWLEAERCDLGALQRHVIVGDTLLGAHPEGMQKFDVVVGNPPWNKIKADLKEFYGHYDPSVMGMQGSQLKQYVSAEFERKPALRDQWTEHRSLVQRYVRHLLDSPDYVHQKVRTRGRGLGSDSDFYKFFLERSCQLTRDGGRIGLVLPAALCTAEGSVGLRRMLLNDTKIDALITIENKDLTFPIDSRFKYLILVAERGSGPTTVLPSRYMVPSVDRADTLLARRDMLPVPVKLLSAVSPENCTFVDVRDPLEISLLEKLHCRFPALGTKLPDSWNVRFVRELDMTNDSDLFNGYHELREKGYQRCPDGCCRNQKGHEFVPLMEGRMVHQFDHAFKAYVSGHGRKAVWKQLPWSDKWIMPHYFVDREDASPVSGYGNLRVGYCDVTGQTNERTVLAALIPEESVAGNKVPTLRVDNFRGDEAQIHLLWVAIANSFVVDWLMRVRMSTTINFFHWYQIPFPRLSPALPQAAELIEAATQLSMVGPHRYLFSEEDASSGLDTLGLTVSPNDKDLEEWERQYIRANIDACVADLYGLSTLEYANILSTFPLLDRQQPFLPGDLGKDGKPRSYITRDLALLTYYRRVDAKPPTDIVVAFDEIGIDIEHLTGPMRNLEERVERGLAAGAIAYVPTGAKNGKA